MAQAQLRNALHLFRFPSRVGRPSVDTRAITRWVLIGMGYDPPLCLICEGEWLFRHPSQQAVEILDVRDDQRAFAERLLQECRNWLMPQLEEDVLSARKSSFMAARGVERYYSTDERPLVAFISHSYSILWKALHVVVLFKLFEQFSICARCSW